MDDKVSQGERADLRAPFRGVLVASIAVVVSFLLQSILNALGGYYPFIPFFAAVVASSWLGGRQAGLLATAASTLTVWYFWIPPRFSFYFETPASTLALLLFALTGTATSFLHHRAREDVSSASQANLLLQSRDVARSAELAESLASSQASRARLAGIVESAMDAIISVDSDQRILLFNQAAELMFGCPSQEVLGKSLERFLPPEARGSHGHHVRAFGSKGATSRSMGSLGSLTALRASGEAFPIEASISHMTVAGEKVFTVILRDISEREKAVRDIRERERRLERVIESLAEGLILTRPDGQLLHWNRSAMKMHDFSRTEEWKRTLQDFVKVFELRTLEGELVPFENWPVPQILAGRALKDWKARLVRLDRPWERIFSYAGTMIHENEGPVALLSVTDVTERHLAEEEIRRLNTELEQRVVERTAQLQTANKELEAFSYSVSHDLRAPLRALDGYSQALLEDYGDGMPEEALRYLDTIRRSAQKMGRLIDDLLGLSKLNRQSLNKRLLATDRLVKEVLEELSVPQEERKVEVTVGDLLPCLGDSALLKQVWINLLSNAFKYTSHRQEAKIEVGSRTVGDELIYWIKDNGTGFDMRYAEKLFGVFQRLHRAEDFEGTGVGLAIVARIVERHGGRVWAEGKLDQGATFSFALPGEGAA